MRRRLLISAALIPVFAAPRCLDAQESRSVDLTIGGAGISIGDSRGVTGLRLNFRDTRLERVNGVNLTVWTPTRTSNGVVNGAALGVPATGADEVNGLAAGIFGVGVERHIRGIGVGGIGIGGGGTLEGLMVGGIGVGSGGGVRGISLGGIGVGSGGDVTGISIGGFGVGGGGRIRGISVGGFGVGGGGDVVGLNVAGFGVGSGGDILGISLAGVGVGGGGTLTGLTIAGLGIGTGGGMRGIQVAGFGVGSPRVEGVTVAGGAVGGATIRGLTAALGYVRVDAGRSNGIARPGRMAGATIASVNHIKGVQHGLAIGIVNSAWTLEGVQVGLLNHARNNPPLLRWLPVINANLR